MPWRGLCFLRYPVVMADITWAMVTAFAAELTVVPESAQDDILAYVNTALKVELFGGEDAPKTKLARIYMAAHYGQLTKDGAHGPAGEITGKALGPMSTSYASSSPMGTDPLWDKTTWGKQFRSMLRSSAARVPIVI